MLPQMALTSCLAFIALLLCFFFSVNPQPYDYPNAIALTSSTKSRLSLPHNRDTSNGAIVRSLLLRLNSEDSGDLSYCFPPCKNCFLSIYIIYAISVGGITSRSPQKVIWSTNRAQPVGENATFQLTSQDGLTLCDNDGSTVWIIDVASRSVFRMNITGSDKLVLVDKGNFIIWQFIDHSIDSLVMGQMLARGMRIFACFSSTELAESRLYLSLLADGLFGFVDSNSLQIYYPNSHISSPNKIVDKSAFIISMNASLTMLSTLSNPSENKTLFYLPPQSTQYTRLKSDENSGFYYINGMHRTWVHDEFNRYLNYKYDYPTICGKYGICNNEQCTENYFVPVDNRRAALSCSAVNPITCQDAYWNLWSELYSVYYSYSDLVAFSTIDEESCKKACLRNCSCKVALFQSSNGNSLDGKCLTLTDVFPRKNDRPKEEERWLLNCEPLALTNYIGLLFLVGIVFVAQLFIFTLKRIYRECLSSREEAQDEDSIKQLPGMPIRFTFEELRAATENFVRKLGEGGFGTVFEGRWGDERLAVKRLDNVRQGKEDFLAEVEATGSINHINVVRLIGFCVDRLNRFLVYKYMCNGSLDKWISCRDGRVPLDWSIRFGIITDIAKGLCYLHEECRQRIMHFDIKPENILLDENFNAKVFDFGLSKLINQDMSGVMTQMRGTPGYMAPECLTTMVTEKVDVYSFGVIVMEILSGRRNINNSQTEENHHLIKLLQDKSKSNELSDLIDKNLGDVELYKNEVVNVMKLAMWCLQWDSTRRPSMLMVIKVLDRAMEVETSLDYNFVSSIPIILNLSGLVDQSAPLPASVLSGPR